jgi:soluble lytic murein transglycosylase-like protein
MPERLISAIIQAESGFNPRARSQKGAQGLMQLMPATASALGVRNALDPKENIDAGVRHLSGLVERFGNNLRLAIAAYNAGEKAVVAYGGIPPYPETREYVMRVLRFYGAPGDVAPVRGVYHKIAPDGTVIYTNLQPRDVP